MKKLNALYICCFVLIALNTFAQNNNYVTSRYTIADGLPHNRVSSLKFDQQGFLWLATSNGLFRFDSYKFKEYAQVKADTSFINSPYLESLLVDSKGNIWSGYYIGGIIKYNPKDQSVVSYLPDDKDSTAICGNRIRSICEDKEGNIWVGSGANGIAKLDIKTQTFKHYLRRKTKSGVWVGQDIGGIICTRDSNIWAAGIGGLYKYNKKKDLFKRIGVTKKRKGETFATIAEDTVRNCIWLGGWFKMLARIDLKTGKGKWKRTPLGPIVEIHPDSKGVLWLGTWGNGILRYDVDAKKFESHTFEGDSTAFANVKTIRSITEDTSGEIWVSTHYSGILSISQSKAFKKHDLPSYAKSQLYTRDLAYLDNKLFIATQKGLLIKPDSGQFEHIKRRSSKYDNLERILRVNDDKLWVTNHEFIDSLYLKDGKYKLKKIWLFKKGAFTDTRKVSGMLRDGDLIYISTIHYPITIYKYNKKGNHKFIKRFNPQNKIEGSVSTSKTNDLFKDSKGKIWIGTVGGLYQIKNKDKMIPAHRLIKNGKKLGSDLILEIKEDNKGRILVCTGKGLNVLTPSDNGMYSLSVYDDSKGLPENNVRSCAVDHDGIVWISTNTNIVRINLDSEEVSAFGRKDGINVEEFTRSSIVKPDGKIIFGGKGCYLEFDPSEVKMLKKTPRLELSGFSILNNPIKAGEEFNNRVILEKAINFTKKLKITYKEKEFTIELSLLEYQKNKNNFYEYKLVGFDHDWVQLGRQRSISFTNLPAGKYELQARAITSEGYKINLPTPLKITVTPPWWKTAWFRISLIIFIITTSVSFYQYRMNAIKAQNRKLEEQVQQRTQEIKQQSEEIKTQRDNLVEQKSKLEDANQLLKDRQEEILMRNEEIQQQAEEITAQRDYVKKQNLEIEEGLKNMELLSEFGQKLTATLSLTVILRMVHNYVASIVKTDAFGVGLYRDKKKRIDYHAFYEDGKAIDLFSNAHDPQKSFSSWAIENKKEIFENSVLKNFRLYFNEVPSLNTSFEAKSVLVFPLFSEEKVIGVFSVYSREEDSYLQKDFAFVKSLSAYISIAVANARLYGEMNRKNENIQSSIAYARNIQKAILPLKQHMDTFVQTFTLYMPKAVVSGDFYWHTDISEGDKKEAFFAVIDCTGHGVPGAFMSLIGNRILNRIVNERGVHEPASILTELDKFIIDALKQRTTENNDGMDVALCKVTQSEEGATVVYAGAKRNLILIDSKGEINIAKGTRKSIGGAKSRRNNKHFTSETIELTKGTTLYLTSDGYADQNGVNESKFGSAMLLDYLSKIYTEDMEKQAHLLEKTLLEHMGGFEQRDDITIMGVKIL